MKRTYLSDSVAEEIKRFIVSQKLVAGEKLPSSAIWMEQLNVGRSTLREGFKKLEVEGIIEVVNGKGTFVKEQKPFRIYTSFQVNDERKHLLEVLDVRTALEARAVELAVENATAEQVREMEIHLLEYKKYREANDFVMASKEDTKFHKTIYRASGNHILFEIITSIHNELYVLWESTNGMSELYDESYPYHIELLEGIKHNDKTRATEAFYALVKSVKENIIKISQS